MREFHHHPDQLVYLRVPGVAYADSLANFLADAAAAGLPVYPGLPEGTRERRYRPDAGLHAVYTADSQIGAECPWPAGDAYLDGALALVNAQAVRTMPPPKEEPEEEEVTHG